MRASALIRAGGVAAIVTVEVNLMSWDGLQRAFAKSSVAIDVMSLLFSNYLRRAGLIVPK